MAAHRYRSDYDSVYAKLLHLANRFSGTHPNEAAELWNDFYAFVYDLAGNGWTRGHIYHLVGDVLTKETDHLSDESKDALYDFDSALLGHGTTVRLPGEPTDELEFKEYVYGREWMNT